MPVRMMSRPELRQAFAGAQPYGMPMQQPAQQHYPQYQMPPNPAALYYYNQDTARKRHEADVRRLVRDALIPEVEQWREELAAKNEEIRKQLRNIRDEVISELSTMSTSLESRQHSMTDLLRDVYTAGQAMKEEPQHVLHDLQSLAEAVQQLEKGQKDILGEISTKLDRHQKQTRMQLEATLGQLQHAPVQAKMEGGIPADTNRALLCDISAQLENIQRLLEPSSAGTKRKTRSRSKSAINDDLESLPLILQPAVKAMKNELRDISQEILAGGRCRPPNPKRSRRK